MRGESTAQILYIVSNIAFVLSAICLVMAIIFFIKFRIPSVFNDLTGRTARKSIEQIRKKNEKNGNKAHRPGKINDKRGKLTEPMNPEESEKLKSNSQKEEAMPRPETGLLHETRVGSTELENATSLLADNGETGLLDSENETAPLDTDEETLKLRDRGMEITTLEQGTYIHTEEII